jgi:hypothetical protein
MTQQKTPVADRPTAATGPKWTVTPHHSMALVAVRDGAVVCHPAWSHHVPGWGWSGGGDVSLPVQNALSDLHSGRLLTVDTTVRDHVDGDPVVLTEAGRLVLERMGGQ